MMALGDKFEAKKGSARLRAALESAVPDRDYAPGHAHQLLVRLPWADILTTNWDSLLERAVDAYDRSYDTVITVKQIASAIAPRIVKLHGCARSGTDLIFTEALRDLSEFEAFRAAVDVPLLANMTEFGKSELFTRQQLADAGVAMVIYPVTLLRSAMGAAERVLDAIKEEGTQQSQVEQMLTRARLYELVDYEGYNAFDTGIFNFDVPTLDIGANHADL